MEYGNAAGFKVPDEMKYSNAADFKVPQEMVCFYNFCFPNTRRT
jgi:hypothetical protein